MGYTLSLVHLDLVSGDVKATVDLYFVRVDDLGGEACGEVDGEFGFSGAGGSHDNDDLVLGAITADRGIHASPPGSSEGGLYRRYEWERLNFAAIWMITGGDGEFHRNRSDGRFGGVVCAVLHRYVTLRQRWHIEILAEMEWD